MLRLASLSVLASLALTSFGQECSQGVAECINGGGDLAAYRTCLSDNHWEIRHCPTSHVCAPAASHTIWCPLQFDNFPLTPDSYTTTTTTTSFSTQTIYDPCSAFNACPSDSSTSTTPTSFSTWVISDPCSAFNACPSGSSTSTTPTSFSTQTIYDPCSAFNACPSDSSTTPTATLPVTQTISKPSSIFGGGHTKCPKH